METATGRPGHPRSGILVRMLGPLSVVADGTALALPASRKTRALFAYLAFSGEAVGRSRLCELLWEIPSDPRGELRWCLSKIRALLGQAAREAVETCGEMVRFNLDDGSVDARDIAAAAKGIERLDIDRLRAAIHLFAGDFLEGLEIDRSPQFSSWLTAQRRRSRSLHAAFLEQLARRLPAGSDERADDRDRESDLAIGAAGMSLLVDEHSPAAHWAMGRALWLRGRQDEALRELETAVELSPNFALGHYTLAFVHSQSGDPETAIRSSDLSRRLSPFDPLLFAMLSCKAVSFVRLGRFEEATEWALQGAARPNAHNIILATAAHCLAFLGRIDEARTFVALIRRSVPGYSVDDYLTSFRFKPEDAALFRESGKRIGLDR